MMMMVHSYDGWSDENREYDGPKKFTVARILFMMMIMSKEMWNEDDENDYQNGYDIEDGDDDDDNDMMMMMMMMMAIDRHLKELPVEFRRPFHPNTLSMTPHSASAFSTIFITPICAQEAGCSVGGCWGYVSIGHHP